MIKTFTPRNEAAWHRLRSKDITASVAGALLGEHEFTTKYELWAIKTGKVYQDPEETPAMQRGRLLEPVAVQILRELHPEWEITHNTGNTVVYYRDTESRIGATPDVIVNCPKNGRGIVQIKSVEKTAFRRKWLGDNETPEPPLWIAVQAIIEAYMTDSKWAAVAPLVIGYGIELPVINIPIFPGVIERIKNESKAFWNMVENGEEPAPDYNLDANTISDLYSVDSGDEVDLSRDKALRARLIERTRLAGLKREYEAVINEIDAEIKHKMQGATLAHLAGGDKITWRTQRKIGENGRASAFRVLRVPAITE